MNEPLIVAEKITQEFLVGDEVVVPLKDVSCTIDRGSFTIIFGPSGSGKSTLLNVIAGLQKPTKGTAQFAGTDIYSLDNDKLAAFRARQIGTIYQDNYWIKSLSALENVCLPLFALGYSRAAATEKAKGALERVGMTKYANKPPFVLSLGEQQRIAAARAIVANPPCIIADEPTGNLDKKNGDAVMRLLHEICAEQKTTVILVTHNLEYVADADEVLRMRDGVLDSLSATSGQSITEQLVSELTTDSAKGGLV